MVGKSAPIVEAITKTVVMGGPWDKIYRKWEGIPALEDVLPASGPQE
jgi:hypothetical protein